MDFRQAINAVSDVITNRPPPLREFDQIYMKAGDMFLQAEHCGRWFKDRDVVFIGDGDGLGLLMMHLGNEGILQNAPRSIHVLDFDERIVNSVRRFAKTFGMEARITSELYNVSNPMPKEHLHRYQGFYTNPPYGQFNDGRSIEVFVGRGIECAEPDVTGCIVIADDPKYAWTGVVLESVQARMLQNGLFVAEMLPQFHSYHLDDAPDLTSCSMIFRRNQAQLWDCESRSISEDMLKNFYGKDAPLRYEYVLDKTNGGKSPSRDYALTPFER